MIPEMIGLLLSFASIVAFVVCLKNNAFFNPETGFVIACSSIAALILSIAVIISFVKEHWQKWRRK